MFFSPDPPPPQGPAGSVDIVREAVVQPPGATLLAPELQSQLAAIRDLPSPPKLARDLIEIAEQPDVSLGAVSAIIEKDPALSARLLRVANSSLYSRQRRRDTVRQAILALGLNGTMTLALTFSLVGSVGREAKPRGGIDYQHFWQRSLMAGSAARALAEAACLSCGEQAFLAAILQDIGVVVLDLAVPEIYEDAPDLLDDHAGLIVHEQGCLATSHAEVGAWLLDRWRLAEPICEAVATSHGAGAIPDDDEFAGLARCVALSGDFADIWFMEEPHEAMRQLAVAAEHLLGIGPGELLDIFVQLREQLGETEAIFDMHILDGDEAQRIADKAGELLSSRDFLEGGSDAGARVCTLAELRARLGREFPAAQRNRWPLSVAAIQLAEPPLDAPVAPAAVERARMLLPDTAALGCLDDTRMLVVYAGSDAADAMTATRALLQALAQPAEAGAAALLTPARLRAGVATAGLDARYGDADNLVRAATAALHAAVRDDEAGAVHEAMGEEGVVALGASTIDDFMAAQAR